MSYYISELKSENKYTQSLPAYLRGIDGYSYVKFYSFIKMITNYVKTFQSELEKIYDCMLNYGELQPEVYSRSVIDILCDNYGVNYAAEIPLLDLNTALRCAGLRRSSFSTLADMNSGFLSLSRIFTSYTIKDNSVLDKEKTSMDIVLDTWGNTTTIDWIFLFGQILPNVTGVAIKSTYLSGIAFAYDYEYVENKQEKYGGWDIGSWRWETIK